MRRSLGPAVLGRAARLLARGFSCSARTSNENRSYKTSIAHLNSLQSNAATINAIRNSKAKNTDAIPEMRSWLARAGVAQSDIDELKILHVAGTKGKGSTCAMVSSILSKYRLAFGRIPKIGLYTSPHLQSVRERIQIDGAPIPEDEWTEYFYDVWDSLEASGAEKPVYFRFITILAFHAFIQECVDVVVLECGVGGEYDSTNIITKPVASGVTSLGVDHVFVLGKTIEEIAWHKAGIFKADCPAFTVPQPSTAMDVLKERAMALKVKTFETVPEHPALEKVKLGLNGAFQKSNASLAIVLANEFLKTQGVDENLTSRLPDEFIQGLQDVKWPGRCERRTIDNIEWCLDGGHTSESLTLTGEWFNSLPPTHPNENSTTHNKALRTSLIFNQQSRDACSLLTDLFHALADTQFDRVVFCSNKTFRESGYSPELTSINNSSTSVDSLQVQHALARKWRTLTHSQSAKVEVCGSIQEAIEVVKGVYGDCEGRVLVTGSLHLVGGVMTVLDHEGEK